MCVKKYFKYIKPYRLYFILGPLLMLTEVAGEIVLPKLVGGMIDNGANGLAGEGFIIRQALMMLGCICLMITGGISGHYFAIKASVNFSSDLRKAVFDKVQEFSFRDIDSFSAGSLITRLTNDITQIMNITRMGLIMAVRSPGMLIGGIIMAFSINKSLASVLLVMLPVLAFAIFFIMRMAMPRFARMQKGIDNLNSTTQENISNVRVIKSFVRQEKEKEKFSDANGELCNATLGALKVMVCTMPVMTLCMNIATLATLWRGGNVVIAGGLEVGSLNAIIQYITQILSSLMMVSMMIINSSRAITSFKRVGEVLDTVPDLSDADAQHPEKTVTDGKVEFKNVSFRYHTSNKDNVLSDVSFVAEAGKTLGIVGVTGSGKSSLVQLIPRLYDVTSGEVLVDGVNVKDYSMKNLRDGVGMVLQKNVLFSGSITENMHWGDADADMDKIRHAADLAQADAFVTSFTDGYETELGQGGSNVSGGQKQRLCIARALLKSPKILILDDSTSAVDTATESRIRKVFNEDLKDTTKIIIAQRVASVEDADMILVMDNGKITAVGKHNELLEKSDIYREVYNQQVSGGDCDEE